MILSSGHSAVKVEVMASHEELIEQFTDVTGVEAERAQFYLESSAWHLDVRLRILINFNKLTF